VNDDEIGLVTYAGFKTETFKNLSLDHKQMVLRQYFLYKVAWMGKNGYDKKWLIQFAIILDLCKKYHAITDKEYNQIADIVKKEFDCRSWMTDIDKDKIIFNNKKVVLDG
jgi:hypothetical protein